MSENPKAPVLRKDRGAICRLTLNRPEHGNSLSVATIEALHAHLTDLRAERSIAVIILAGMGDRIFCAGHDLKEFLANADREFPVEVAAKCSAMMQAFRDQPQIIIAQVEGVATAAGCQLVAAADMAVAARAARFATPGVNIGLWCWTPMVALGRNVHPKHAMQMLTTGALYDAEFALRAGLVNAVVDADELDDAVQALATEVASKSTYTLALGKQAFYRQLQMPIADAYAYAGELTGRNMAHHDAQEGIQAFVEKRAPVWRGR